MSDDDPFGDIKTQLEGTEGKNEDIKDADHSEDDEDNEQPQEPIGDDEDDKDAEDAEDGQDDKEDRHNKHGPPFPFSESKQGPIYPHEDRWDEWADAKWEIKVYLRENGLRETHGREIDDALLQLAIESPEEIGDIILDARGYDDLN